MDGWGPDWYRRDMSELEAFARWLHASLSEPVANCARTLRREGQPVFRYHAQASKREEGGE